MQTLNEYDSPHFTRRRRQLEQPFDLPPTLTMLPSTYHVPHSHFVRIKNGPM